eukprot:1671510-Pyramimonas_sp.AAC.1
MIERWRSWRRAAGRRAPRARSSSHEWYLVVRVGRVLQRRHRHQLGLAVRRHLMVANVVYQLALVLE